MLATLSAPALFLGLLLASFVLWALFLRLGLRWAKVPDVTTRRFVLDRRHFDDIIREELLGALNRY